jgi:hypothetical protein
MKKIILSTVLVFCFGLIYGQFEVVKNTIGIEQETVFNDLVFNDNSGEMSLWANHREFSFITYQNKRVVCRVFVLKSKFFNVEGYIKAAKDVMERLKGQRVDFSRIPNLIEFYFNNDSKYKPNEFTPAYPNVEKYDGIKEHHVIALTHMSDWSKVCKIITPVSHKKKTMLRNRLTYAMGRILHEFSVPAKFYWDPTSNLNRDALVAHSSDNEFTNISKELNRYATHSPKAFVAELFTYGVEGNLAHLEKALPSSVRYKNKVLNFYFNICNGPMCSTLQQYRQ